jgi:hypothetical protein
VIKSNGTPDTESTIRNLVADSVIIHQKYKNKGHTHDNDIKKIDKTVEISNQENKLIVKLGIHVHHYITLFLPA